MYLRRGRVYNPPTTGPATATTGGYPLTDLLLAPLAIALAAACAGWGFWERRRAAGLRRELAELSEAQHSSQALLSVTEAVNSSLAVEEVLKFALAHAAGLAHAAAGAFYLLRGPGELVREASLGLSAGAACEERRLEAEPVSGALGGRPGLRAVSDGLAPGLPLGRPSHLLVVPVESTGRLLGTIELYFLGPAALSDRQLDLLQGLAASAATAIRNAQLYREQEESSLTDELTGLPNRRYLAQRFLQETTRARRHQKALAVMMLDIDHFKQINDAHGHLAGDAVLADLGSAIRGAIRQSDVCARYGGEEFAALLTETGLDGALVLAERLRGTIERSRMGGREITVSIGVAATSEADQLTALIDYADRALYEAKETGRNRVCARAPKGSRLEQPAPR